jgi:transcriptional regulator with XRE-family HTH domain
MIAAARLRAAGVLRGIDQRQLAELSGLSVPTLPRMEASETMLRANADSPIELART